jgi:hypothetical protein
VEHKRCYGPIAPLVASDTDTRLNYSITWAVSLPVECRYHP